MLTSARSSPRFAASSRRWESRLRRNLPVCQALEADHARGLRQRERKIVKLHRDGVGALFVVEFGALGQICGGLCA